MLLGISKWGYINRAERVVIPYTFADAGNFLTRNAYVSNGEKYAIIDMEGNLITEWVYDTLFNDYRHFIDQKNGLYGIIDSVAKEVIPFIYEDYNGGYKGNYVFKKNGKWGTVGFDYEDFDNTPAFLTPDVMPKFPGCPKVADEKEWKDCSDKKMLQYIYTQIQYPTEAHRSGVEGTVVVSFLVNKKGEIEQAEVEKLVQGAVQSVLELLILCLFGHQGNMKGKQ